MDELYPNIDNEITPPFEELEKEKDDIIREYREYLLTQHYIIILKDRNQIIGIYSPSLMRTLFYSCDWKGNPRKRFAL